MSRCRFTALALAGLVMLHGMGAPAEESPPVEPREITEAEVLSYFDRELARLNKKHHFELAPFVGPILGEALPTSIFYGLRSNFFLTKRLSAEFDGAFSAAGIDPFTLGTVTTEGDRDSYFLNGNIQYIIPAFIRPRAHIVLPIDLFVTGGAGAFNFGGDFFKPTINVGGGTRIYFAQYFVLRIDVRNYLIWIDGPQPDDGKLSANALIMFGLSFFLPPVH